VGRRPRPHIIQAVMALMGMEATVRATDAAAIVDTLGAKRERRPDPAAVAAAGAKRARKRARNAALVSR
jgi:hypothetical protein